MNKRVKKKLNKKQAQTGKQPRLSREAREQIQQGRADYDTWTAHVSPDLDKEAEATPASAVLPFRPLGALISERLQWRLIWLYRQIAYKCNNLRGYCWAGTEYFVDEWRRLRSDQIRKGKEPSPIQCSAATIRRWIEMLVQYGWIRVEISGPNRHIYLCVHPSQVLGIMGEIAEKLFGVEKKKKGEETKAEKGSFSDSFKRLLSTVLGGLEPLSFMVTQLPNSKKKAAVVGKGESVPEACPLSVDEQAVVVELVHNGINPQEAAIHLVKTHGVSRCKEQLEALPYRNCSKAGKAGLLRKAIDQGYSLPDKLIKAREKALKVQKLAQEAEANRKLQEEQRVERAAKRKAEQEAKALAEREREDRIRTSAGDILYNAWQSVKEIFSKEEKNTILRWLRPVTPVSLAAGVVTLAAPSAEAEWLNKRQDQTLADVLSQILGQSVQVDIIAATDPASFGKAAPPNEPIAKPPVVSSGVKVRRKCPYSDVDLAKRLPRMSLHECEVLLETSVSDMMRHTLENRVRTLQESQPPAPEDTVSPSPPVNAPHSPKSDIASLIEATFGKSETSQTDKGQRKTGRRDT